jgi:multidrug efflux pump subunit AcrA (membrane-fusion protein)
MSLMNVIRFLVSLGILAGSIGIYFWLGKAEPPKGFEPVVYPAIVEVSPVHMHSGPMTFEVDGVVVPFRQIELAAEVGGRVEWKSDACRAGKRVKKNELLFRIDPTDYQLEIRRLTEEKKAAQAQIRELKSEISAAANRIESLAQQLEIDKRQTERINEMARRKAASSSEVDTAQRTELATRNEWQSLIDQKALLESRETRLETTVALAEANLDRAQLSLERTEIRAPIDAIVVTDQVEQDGYVQLGSIVLTLQDIQQVDVACKLQMDQMNWLWLAGDNESTSPETQAPTPELSNDSIVPKDSMSAKLVSVQAESKKTDSYFPLTPARIQSTIGNTVYQWTGIVDRYDGAGIDQTTRMVPCRINIAQPENAIVVDRPSETSQTLGSADLAETQEPRGSIEMMTGMFVKVFIDVTPPKPMLRMPHSAVQPGNAVWTVREGKLSRVPIDIVTNDTNGVFVSQSVEGIQTSDVVVTSPLATPIEGMQVIIKGSPEEQALLQKKNQAQSQKGAWGK